MFEHEVIEHVLFVFVTGLVVIVIGVVVLL